MPTLLENNKLIINFNPSSVPENISFEKTLTTFETRLILDGISIRMSKLCTTSICKPLQILYKNCFDNACFPQTWKNANIIPIQKKGKKQLKKKHLACLVIAYFEKKLKKNKRNLIHYLNFWMMTTY